MNATKFPFLQALVVQMLDSAIHWIKRIYSVDNAIGFPIKYLWIVIYQVDSAIQRLNNRGLEVFYSKSHTVQVKNKILYSGKKKNQNKPLIP